MSYQKYRDYFREKNLINYYLNREEILKKQREKYAEKKKEKERIYIDSNLATKRIDELKKIKDKLPERFKVEERKRGRPRKQPVVD